MHSDVSQLRCLVMPLLGNLMLILLHIISIGSL